MGANFLQRQQAIRDEVFRVAERITRQYDLDTLQIALSRYPKLDLGYTRIMEICQLWSQVQDEYDGALKRHPEQDYIHAGMDRELGQIQIKARRRTKFLPFKFLPFKDRYPELRKPM